MITPVQIGILAGVGGSYKLELKILQCFHLGALTSQMLSVTLVRMPTEARPRAATSHSPLQARQAGRLGRKQTCEHLDLGPGLPNQAKINFCGLSHPVGKAFCYGISRAN